MAELHAETLTTLTDARGAFEEALRLAEQRDLSNVTHIEIELEVDMGEGKGQWFVKVDGNP